MGSADTKNEDQKFNVLSIGSHEAFTEMYLAYVGALVAFLRVLLKSQDEAEEVAQEVFVKIWEALPTLDPERSIKSYIFTFAKREAIDRIRHRKVVNKYVSHIGISAGSLADILPDQLIVAKEIELAVEIALQKMPPKQREVFIMSRTDGMTDDELAIKFNISKRTVQTHIYNATKFLKEYLLLM